MTRLRAALRRPWVIAPLVLVAVLAAAGGALDAGTHFQTQGLAWVAGPQAVPVDGWSRPCWHRAHNGRGVYTLPCGRVDGRVLHVQAHDPDGDGDHHLVVLAGRHIVIVKLPRARDQPRRLPSVGDRVSAVGEMTSGRFGLPVVETDALRPG